MSEFNQILALLEPVSRGFRDAGHELYLVGGIVRDQVLNGGDLTMLSGDIDLTTSARPGDTKRLLQEHAEALWTQGEQFGTIGAKVGGHSLEITTFRAESYQSDSRKPQVVFGDDLRTDLSRRDFTINAMAVSIPDGVLHDPFDGRSDLAAQVLRTPLDPSISFSDDPLRMLRAARFLPRFDLEPVGDISASARALGHRLAIVSAERIRDEFERLLEVPDPARGLQFLVEQDLLRYVSPAVAANDRQAQACKRIELTTDPFVRRAAFFFGLEPDEVSSDLSRLRFSRRASAETRTVLTLARKIPSASMATPDVRRLVSSAGAGAEPDLIDASFELARIVATVGEAIEGADAAQLTHVTLLQEALSDLRSREDLSDSDPPLSGEQIMEALGLEPGPGVGEVVARLRDRRLEVGPLTAEQALAFIRES